MQEAVESGSRQESGSRKTRRSRGVRKSRRSLGVERVGRVRESEESSWRFGIVAAPRVGMKANKLEDLLIYQKALEGIDAVSSFLGRPGFSRDFDLHKQLSESCGKIPGHIGEGFGQGTDRHFPIIWRSPAARRWKPVAILRPPGKGSTSRATRKSLSPACTKTSPTCSVDLSRIFDARIGRIAGDSDSSTP